MPSLKTTPTLCPICGEGNIMRQERLRAVEHRNQVGEIYLHLSSCDHCGAETADEEESLLNRRAVIRFRKQIDRIPSGAQIRTMRKAARLTQEQAGALFGGGPVAFSKYENDDLIPDEAMTNLLRLAISDITMVDKLQSLKSQSSTTSIRLIQQGVPSAMPSSTWIFEDGSDDFEPRDLSYEVSHSTSETLAEQSGDGTWRRLN